MGKFLPKAQLSGLAGYIIEPEILPGTKTPAFVTPLAHSRLNGPIHVLEIPYEIALDRCLKNVCFEGDLASLMPTERSHCQTESKAGAAQ